MFKRDHQNKDFNVVGFTWYFKHIPLRYTWRDPGWREYWWSVHCRPERPWRKRNVWRLLDHESKDT